MLGGSDSRRRARFRRGELLRRDAYGIVTNWQKLNAYTVPGAETMQGISAFA